MPMFSLVVAACVAVAVCVSGILGLLLQKDPSRKATRPIARATSSAASWGSWTLLLALVLGLLIWTAYGVTTTQKAELQLLSARALEFDLEMKQYGAEAQRGRELLRTELVWAIEQFWGDADAKSQAYDVPTRTWV